MIKEEHLIVGLEFLTQGPEAVLPQSLQNAAFATANHLQKVRSMRDRSRNWTMGRGIQGLGIGEKVSGGVRGKDLCLRVYVDKKKPKSKVRNCVPKTVAVPSVGKLPTDVIEIGTVALESSTERLRPAMPGCSVGHKDVSAGTFGCLVRKRGSASGLYILSNSHVLANSGRGEQGDAVLQPGKHDGGKLKTDTIATLSEFEPFDFSTNGFPNLIDAAIAKVKSSNSVKPEIRILGIKPAGVSKTLKRGMRVRKVGRTTDYTIGEVLDIHYRVRMPYPGQGSAGMNDQVLCTRFTEGGDSGSLVLNDQNRAVGLHFAGSQSSSIFNKIDNVLTAFDIELVV